MVLVSVYLGRYQLFKNKWTTHVHPRFAIDVVIELCVSDFIRYQYHNRRQIILTTELTYYTSSGVH